MTIKQAFGIVLKEEREKQDITQLQLAGYCNLDVQTISMYERGLRQPTIKTLLELARALNVEAEYLVTRLKATLEAGNC
ncbi:MAG: helix-turn-helix domain-containing protein [Cytophagales bacterium]|nr:helix-turn-helix domain-containing protein [Cytophagales bacterium]